MKRQKSSDLEALIKSRENMERIIDEHFHLVGRLCRQSRRIAWKRGKGFQYGYVVRAYLTKDKITVRNALSKNLVSLKSREIINLYGEEELPNADT